MKTPQKKELSKKNKSQEKTFWALMQSTDSASRNHSCRK